MFNLTTSTRLVVASILLISAVLFVSIFPRHGQAQQGLLGTAESFAVLGGSTVTNTGPTVVQRNLGVSPGTAVTGFPPGIVTGGSIHAADAVASQAQSDVTTAYNSLARRACDFDLTGQDLGGLTLIPGVYCFSTSAQLTGQLTLDAQGNAAALFVFQIGSTLTTASNASVLMIGGSPCNVYWQVGSSATIGTTTQFVGNILALSSISLTTGASVTGRVLARNGAVTMDTNTVSAASCAAAPEEPTATSEPATATSETPTPATSTPITPAPATSTPVTPAPATSTPVTPAPATSTPGTPGADETSTPVIPGPIGPGPETPTPVAPSPLTPTPVNPGVETPTASAPGPGTPTPVTPVQTPVTPIAPETSTPVTPIAPGTSTPVTPGGPGTSTPVTLTPTSTPTATATPVTNVQFPDTGTGGFSNQNGQPGTIGTIVLGIASIMLLVGGLGIAVERRSRTTQ